MRKGINKDMEGEGWTAPPGWGVQSIQDLTAYPWLPWIEGIYVPILQIMLREVESQSRKGKGQELTRSSRFQCLGTIQGMSKEPWVWLWVWWCVWVSVFIRMCGCICMCLGDHVFMIGIAWSVAMWLIYTCIHEHGCVWIRGAWNGVCLSMNLYVWR